MAVRDKQMSAALLIGDRIMIDDLSPIATALAVLGSTNAVALTALLGGDGLDVSALPADTWTAPEPEAASMLLAALERSDIARYRLLHERAVTHLADRLRAGDAAVEPAFVAAFDRLANRLLLDDPAQFARLVAAVQDVPLALSIGGQSQRYFAGLALAKADRYVEALASFDALLAEPGLDEQICGRALNSRANCHSVTGRLEQALADYRSSLELWRRLGNRLREGLALLNLGILAYDLQEYDNAEHSLTQAADCFVAADALQWLAAAQNELGLVHRDQGRWAAALTCLDAAAAHYRAEGAQDALGRTLNNIGEVLLFQGRLVEAVAAFHQALAAMSTRIHAVDVHLNLGLAHQVAGDLQGAHAAYQEALNLAVAIGRRDLLAELHYRLGESLRQMDEDAAALAQFEAGAAVIETTRELLRDERLKISLLGRWQQVYEALVLHCLSLGRVAEAFAWAERSRARAFADIIARSETSNPGAGHSAAPPDNQRLMLPATEAEVHAGMPAGAALLCYFTTGVVDRGLSLLRALPPGAPLREHLLPPARTLLFVFTRDCLTAHECPIDPNALASGSPRGDDRDRFLRAAVLRRLYDVLLRPAGGALAAGTLYIFPHGPLHLVPFGALLDPADRPLLHASGPDLAYAPSATVLLRRCLVASPAATLGRPCLVVGYDGAAGGRALRYTETEATFVAGITSGEAWVGPYPDKKQLRLAAGDRRWLHFACHGWFNDESPLESYLEIGPGERLTALDVLRDWRLQAELVTLSACRTGVSRILRGDEPMGLVRAFLYAGARAVLVSQWPVEDLPTLLLMQRFYSELQRAGGADSSAALRAAQVWLARLTAARARQALAALPAGDPPVGGADPMAGLPPDAYPFAHPRHWAAFVLVGR